MEKINQEETLIEVYNLILNLDTQEEERQMLIEFKNSVEQSKDFDRALQKLCENLRFQAVKNITNKKHMSTEMNNFYKKICSFGQFNKNLGRGLISLGTVR